MKIKGWGNSRGLRIARIAPAVSFEPLDEAARAALAIEAGAFHGSERGEDRTRPCCYRLLSLDFPPRDGPRSLLVLDPGKQERVPYEVADTVGVILLEHIVAQPGSEAVDVQLHDLRPHAPRYMKR